MDGDLEPRPAQWRLSDADRKQATERLQAALGEGRLTLAEFEQRLVGVLAAGTFAEVSPILADLPGHSLTPREVPEFKELRTTAASLKRGGDWVVPRRLLVKTKAGSVKLDFTDALITHRTVDIEVDAYAGSVTLVLPPDASANIDDVEMIAASARVRGVPSAPATGPHFVVHGKQYAGGLTVRYQRRFLRWRW